MGQTASSVNQTDSQNGVSGTAAMSGAPSGTAGASGNAAVPGTGTAMNMNGKASAPPVPPAEICRGSAGQFVCDPQGMMYKCSATGAIETAMNCGNARLCSTGNAGMCLTCIPGEFRCTGANLEQCAMDGRVFAFVKTCDNASLCKPAAGDCTDAACVSGKLVCEGDKLRKCKPDQSALEDQQTCMPGMCDSELQQCDACVSGSKMCQGNSVLTCNAQRSGFDPMPCPSATPRCVGMGQCVECMSDNDCGDPGTCLMKYCNPVSQTCQPKPAPSSAACSGGHCDGAGKCVECSAASECQDKACQTKSCSGGRCQWTPVAAGRTSPSCSGSQVCSASQQCVECVDASQCRSFEGTCKKAMCTNNACSSQRTTGESCGSGMVCDNGNCVTQCGNGVIDSGEECDPQHETPVDRPFCQSCKWTSVYRGDWPSCSSPASCPTPTGGENVACPTTGGAANKCYYGCGSAGGVCPPGSTCNQFACQPK